MITTPIIMDGITYRVRTVYNTMERTFSLVEGPNAGTMLSTRRERDLLGTGYSYEMQIEADPAAADDYNAFYEAISAPVPTHEITMPYGNSTITFNAMITGGTDIYYGIIGGVKRWGGLTLTFTPVEVQRT